FSLFPYTTLFRSRARARLARADDDGASARHLELDHIRLRVGLAPASARVSCGDEGGRARVDPRRPSRAVWRDPAEAAPVSRAEGGVLPRRLRARSGHPRRIRDRSAASARGLEAAPGRLARPPPLGPALPTDAEPP